ncbi:MAG TPA: PVC-type heme-binding CxxCH protein [Verrucomicrobiae bacterium]|nr:PVC-type heme-binding CxxCH protein [Verrucomicrobiae bacterium]
MISPRKKTIFIVTAAAMLAASAQAADDMFAAGVRTTDPQAPEEELKAFKVPEGFEIQLVAAEPDLRKPMNMAFDGKGRLWVTESREYPFPAPPDKPARDTIRIFEDFDATGRARKVTIFAEGLNIPIGIYPYGNGCIAWSIPNIWYFQDTDGDGKADKKDVFMGPFGWERDTHGNQASFRRGFDGWLYATHGFNNNSNVRAPDGSEVRMNSGNTYRMAIDGSHIEQHTYGQVNPFGLCFDPMGHMYSADCHSAPIYQLIPGAYYPSFGKPDDGLGFAPLLLQHDHGSTAICGLVFVNDDLWPENLQGHMFVGNVMTSRLNHDTLSYVGSSPKAAEAPDFLTTTDPWFRPVDIQLAPDGALYIADFYNRIIGHYEVPLMHPGRDRDRGRIWRLVPKKGLRQLALKGSDAKSLIEEMGAGSLTRRMLAMNTLIDTVGAEAAPDIAVALKDAPPAQKVHLLWALHRVNKLTLEQLNEASRSQDTDLRVHALRILGAKSKWSEEERAFVQKGLVDANPHLQRAAAEAVATHPQLANVAPMLTLLEQVPAGDDHLGHTARIALRNQLRDGAAWAAVQKTTLPEASVQTLVSIATGIPSVEAAEFLVDHLDKLPKEKDSQQRALRHIARYAPAQKTEKVAEFVQEKSKADIDLQLSILDSVQQGFAQRGLEPTAPITRWALKLAGDVLDESPEWSYEPLDPARIGKNPWFLQQRASADGNKGSTFLCSLPPGGESLTGVLRSRAFDVPSQITFFIAGHDGYPDKPAGGKNVIRLRDEKTREVLAEAKPPRNDMAQKVQWNLKSVDGRRGYIEVVDGDTGDAYAWLAIGRFEPDVAPFPRIDPSALASRQKSAAEIASKFKGIALKPRLEAALVRANTDSDVRPALASALLSFKPDDLLNPLVPTLSETALSPTLRNAIAKAIVDRKDAATLLTNIFREAPTRVQTKVAQSLASTTAGAEKLLELIQDRAASPQLLLDRATADKISGLKKPAYVEQIKKLTEGLSQNEEAQKLIDKRRAEYKPLANDVREGEAIFAQNCAVCHKLNNVGNLVGPQLDGIGNRGLERLLEDLLDPNRNVDRAFRTHVITLKDGDVVSGLPRREEGELLILADSLGKEVSVKKSAIESRRESESSLMPQNFGDLIPAEDFRKLMAFLLTKRGE